MYNEKDITQSKELCMDNQSRNQIEIKSETKVEIEMEVSWRGYP